MPFALVLIVLMSVLEARVVISNWLVEYNALRPHRGLGIMTPAAFAASRSEGPK
jgi:transposase InsO family protein